MKTCGEGCPAQCFCCVAYVQIVHHSDYDWCLLHDNVTDMLDGCEEFECKFIESEENNEETL